MASVGIWDSILLYSFIKRLATPFSKWGAYRTGVIDAKGEILIPKKQRTPVQNRSFRMYDLMLLNIKRLLGKVPGGKSRLASYAAAVMLLREDHEHIHHDDDDMLWLKIQEYFEDAETIITEEIANSVGDASAMAGLDDNPPRKLKKSVLRRKISSIKEKM